MSRLARNLWFFIIGFALVAAIVAGASQAAGDKTPTPQSAVQEFLVLNDTGQPSNVCAVLYLSTLTMSYCVKEYKTLYPPVSDVHYVSTSFYNKAKTEAVVKTTFVVKGYEYFEEWALIRVKGDWKVAEVPQAYKNATKLTGLDA